VGRSQEPIARVTVHVTPGAREDAVLGWQGDILRIRVRARPQDGQANEAVCRLLAQTLRLPASALAIRYGANSRRKLVKVAGLNEADVRKRITGQA